MVAILMMNYKNVGFDIPSTSLAFANRFNACCFFAVLGSALHRTIVIFKQMARRFLYRLSAPIARNINSSRPSKRFVVTLFATVFGNVFSKIYDLEFCSTNNTVFYNFVVLVMEVPQTFSRAVSECIPSIFGNTYTLSAITTFHDLREIFVFHSSNYIASDAFSQYKDTGYCYGGAN